MVRSICSDEAKELLKSGLAILLDVRTPEEYAKYHIDRSILIPLNELSNRISELLKYKNKKILCICRSGNRSYVACKLLEQFGFEVYNVEGGILNWK